MTTEILAALMEIAEKTPEDIARELCNIQPMPSDIWAKLMAVAMDEKDLEEQGYKPVEKNGMSLLWIKENDK